MSLNIAAGLGLGGNESYLDLFQPFGGFPDGVKVDNGHLTLPDLPGIGFEGKADLFKERKALSAEPGAPRASSLPGRQWRAASCKTEGLRGSPSDRGASYLVAHESSFPRPRQAALHVGTKVFMAGRVGSQRPLPASHPAPGANFRNRQRSKSGRPALRAG